MAEVTVSVGGRNYAVACGDGQEDRVRALAARIDAEAKSFAAAGPSVSEARLLLMSALMIADKLEEAESSATSATLHSEEINGDELSAALDASTRRIAAMTAPIARLASDITGDLTGAANAEATPGDDGGDGEITTAQMREIRRARRRARRQEGEEG